MNLITTSNCLTSVIESNVTTKEFDDKFSELKDTEENKINY